MRVRTHCWRLTTAARTCVCSENKGAHCVGAGREDEGTQRDRNGRPLENPLAAYMFIREYFSCGRASMTEARMSLPVARHYGETTRRDLWWVQPLVVFVVLSSFI